MKFKINYILDYIYYKVYRFSKFVLGTWPEMSAISFIVASIGLLVIKIIWLSSEYFPTLKNIKQWQFYVYGGIFYLLVTYYFYKGKRYKKIEERYRNENKTFRRVTDVIFIIALIIYLWVVQYLVLISLGIALVVLFIIRFIKKAWQEEEKIDRP